MPIAFESQYFATQWFFACMLRQPIIIEQHEHYQKRSFRNKCIIQNANSLQILTVPLAKGKHQQLSITEVEISYDEPWQSKHLQAIRSAYGSAPYFEHYYEIIEKEMIRRNQYLFNLNRRLSRVIARLLGIEWSVTYSKKYKKHPPNTADHRQRFTPRNYAEITSFQPYPQVFSERHPFTPNLSILDILFCQGPEAKNTLRKMQA